jgi:hypothetical protein
MSMENSNLGIEQQIDILLKRQLWVPPSTSAGVVPDYLEQGYARETVAAWLGGTSAPTVQVVAALIRAAMTDEEENVRERALRSLRSLAEKGQTTKSDTAAILWASIYDSSSKVRCTALEGIWALDEYLGRECARRLSGDEDWLVAETARNIANAE